MTRLRAIENQAKRLVAKLKVVHDSDSYQAVWFCAQNHIGQYKGPTYKVELDALKSALRKRK